MKEFESKGTVNIPNKAVEIDMDAIKRNAEEQVKRDQKKGGARKELESPPDSDSDE